MPEEEKDEYLELLLEEFNALLKALGARVRRQGISAFIEYEARFRRVLEDFEHYRETKKLCQKPANH
jgi:hypothetical protein